MTRIPKKDVLKRLLEYGLQVTPDLLKYIVSSDVPFDIVDSIVRSGIAAEVPVVTLDLFTSNLVNRREFDSKSENQDVIESQSDYEPRDDSSNGENGWEYNVLTSPKLSDVGSTGEVHDFLALFKDRFEKLRRIYSGRIDTHGAISPKVASGRRDAAQQRRAIMRNGGHASKAPIQTVIGMVKSKSISKSRNTIIELEDEDGTIVCVIPSSRKGLQTKHLVDAGNSLLLDEVICISGRIDRDGRLIADKVIYPDVPTTRAIGRATRDVYAVFISDIHCGSKEFLEEDFDRFIDWIAGRNLDPKDKELVNRIRYLFIAGDLCEGIGVYPGQQENLAIENINDQYAMLAGKLNRLPKGIKIFCIPGNHDASRQALPRPPIPEVFADELYKLGNRIEFLGDPSQVLVEGVSILLTHGDSLDDLVTLIPGASYKEPHISMIELLKKRHLAPLYGGKTELAPLSKDWLVIDPLPDIVHFGHAHHNAVENYRGIQVINSGTFQGQTDFMRKQGVEPTPGIVTFVNLRNGAADVRVFHDYQAFA